MSWFNKLRNVSKSNSISENSLFFDANYDVGVIVAALTLVKKPNKINAKKLERLLQ